MSGTDHALKLDVERLRSWLAETSADFRGSIEVEKFPGGQSNPTYRVATPERVFVLRKKPPGVLLKGAHAIEREYRVIRALSERGYPVPEAYLLCEDETVIGSPFYLMEFVNGRIFWDPKLPEVPRRERRAYYEAMCRTIADLHSIDFRAAGLADFGKHRDFVARQVRRWSQQYEEDEAAGRIPAMDRLCEWLPENIPRDDSTAICHGDYRCDNLIFDPVEPRVIAVLDWELSTLGDPLADFTYHLMSFRAPDGVPGSLSGRDPRELGLPDEAEYAAWYCRATGRQAGIASLDFYLAYNMWRLAAIIHGIKGRMLRGTAASAEAGRLVDHLESLADAAWEQAVKAGAER